jgi:hypothetical protein
MKKFLLIVVSFLPICIVAGGLVLKFNSSFGGQIDGEKRTQISSSDHSHNGAFFNQERWAPGVLTFGYLQEQFFGTQQRVPPSELPLIPIDPKTLTQTPDDGLRIIWIGHGGTLLEIDGVRLLIDPVFFEFFSPFLFFAPRRFRPPLIPLDKLQGIDGVVISHDHYNHLDMVTVQHLEKQGTEFFVPLGIWALGRIWSVGVLLTPKYMKWNGAINAPSKMLKSSARQTVITPAAG